MKLTYFLMTAGGALCAVSATGQDRKSPNIIVILLDDVGYSDLECYGSEIETLPCPGTGTPQVSGQKAGSRTLTRP